MRKSKIKRSGPKRHFKSKGVTTKLNDVNKKMLADTEILKTQPGNDLALQKLLHGHTLLEGTKLYK